MSSIRRFTKNVENRKELVKKISSITGIASRYTGMPRMAYEIGNFLVEKDGTLAVTMSEDGNEGAVILALKADSMIGEEIITPTQASSSEETENTEITGITEITAESVNVVYEAASELPNLPAMETTEGTETSEGLSITNYTAEIAEAIEQPQAASEEGSEEAEAEPDTDEANTESINTPEIETEPVANMAEVASDKVADITDNSDAEADADNHRDENCLLGTEDWDGGEDSSDEDEIEPQTPVIELQELPELPPDNSAEEDDSLSEVIQASQTTQPAIDEAGTAETAISGAASELSNQQGMEGTELTNITENAVTEDVRTVTTEQPQAARLETSEECQQISEAPEPTASIEPTAITNCADNADIYDNGFSFSLADHTTRSMLNLINMIYTRGALLSKSTGGHFEVDKDLITVLTDDEEYESKEFLVDFIKEHVEEGAKLDGLSFTNDHVTFTGFPQTTTATTERGITDQAGTTAVTIAVTTEKLEVFKRLAARMNKMAKEQKRIVPKEITEPNEKSAFRIWLIRLGMNGEDCKQDRKILLENLSGHTAFRTEADKEKWIARQNAKKRKMHEAFEREETATTAAVITPSALTTPITPTTELSALTVTEPTATVQAAS